MGVVVNSRLIDGEDFRCINTAGIVARAWYRMPMWIKLEIEPPIMSSRIDLVHSRESWRCHDRLSTHMYEKT